MGRTAELAVGGMVVLVLSASLVEDVFDRRDRLNLARPDVPTASQGNSFQGQFDRPKAFRTRSNTMGVMQWAGQSTTPRSVKIRYRLVVTTNPGSAQTLTDSARLAEPAHEQPNTAETAASPDARQPRPVLSEP